GRRAEIRTGRDGRGDAAGGLVLHTIGGFGVKLEVLGGIVFDRLAGFEVDTLGPVHLLDCLHGLEELAIDAVERIFEAVAPRMGENPAVFTVDLGVDDDVAASLVVVAVIVRRVLVVPPDLAGRGVERDGARGVEVVTRAVGGVECGYRIAGTPIGEGGGGIVRAGDVEGAAAGLP